MRKFFSKCAPESFRELTTFLLVAILLIIVFIRGEATELAKWAMTMIGGYFVGRGTRH